MKNVHLITKEQEGADVLHQYLYITSEEAIKEGDWYLIEFNGLKITQCNSVEELISIEGRDDCKKIILTTDPDLIGVQSIDNEFLEWFVKNPSCENVVVITEQYTQNYHKDIWYNRYKIIIPQEESKRKYIPSSCDLIFEAAALVDNEQETLEDIKLEEVFGSEYCAYSVIENKLAIIYRNQEKLLKAIKLLRNEK